MSLWELRKNINHSTNLYDNVCQLGIIVENGSMSQTPGSLVRVGRKQPDDDIYKGSPTILPKNTSLDKYVWAKIVYRPEDQAEKETDWFVVSVVFESGSEIPDNNLPNFNEENQTWNTSEEIKSHYLWAEVNTQNQSLRYTECAPARLVFCNERDIWIATAGEL